MSEIEAKHKYLSEYEVGVKDGKEMERKEILDKFQNWINRKALKGTLREFGSFADLENELIEELEIKQSLEDKKQ